jgi:hypothetical protein
VRIVIWTVGLLAIFALLSLLVPELTSFTHPAILSGNSRP